jgi:capsular exopolysaccharide synthesis family protein
MEALPPSPYEAPQEANPREYWMILRRRKWVVLLSFLLCVLASLFYTWRTPRQYFTSSKIIVEKPTGAMSFLEYSLWSGQINPNTQIALVRTRPVARLASAYLLKGHGLRIDAESILNALKVEAEPNTEIIKIGVQWPNASVARKIANAMAFAFVQHRQNTAREGQDTTLKFLNQSLDKALEDLRQSEEKLQRFQQATKFVGLTPDQKEDLSQLARAQASLADARMQYAVAQQQLVTTRTELEKQNASLAKLGADSFRNNTYVQKLQADLIEKENELRDAEETLTPEGVATLQAGLKEKVARLREQLGKQLQTVVGGQGDLELQQSLVGTLAKMQADEMAGKARVTSTEAYVRTLEAQRDTLPAKQRELEHLLLDKEANEKMYTLLRQKQKETEISKVSTIGNARVAEEAVTDVMPVWPRPKQNLIFAMAMGLMLGIAGAFLLEYLDDTIGTPDDVDRHLRLTTLGSIPMIKEPGNRLLSQVSPRSGLAEGYRMIRSAVSFSSIDEPLQTIMVTSAGPGEGKSLMAANLAVVQAQKGLRVLLVDCDLRRPSQQKLFDLTGMVGFTNLVVGTSTVDEAAQNVGIDNLRVISSGPLPPNPAEMLESTRARQVVEELKRHADLVVFDTPPCAALSDPVVLSTMVDGVILVVECGETDRSAALRAVHHLAAAKARILGTILNKVNLNRDGYYSYYYYQYYYNSYYSDEMAGGRRSMRNMLTAPGRKRDEEI